MNNDTGSTGFVDTVTDCPCGADHQLIIATHLGDTSGCWLWAGTIEAAGYGRVRHARRTWRAHRLSYIAFVGPVPVGLVLDHLCSERSCVNPGHLEPVTNRENTLRAAIAISECKYGHPLAPYDGSPRPCLRCLSMRAKARAIRGLPGVDPRHGTVNGYRNYGCRCAPCRAAGSADNRAQALRRQLRAVAA